MLNYLLLKSNVLVIYMSMDDNRERLMPLHIDGNDVRSFGTVDCIKWVCYDSAGERDLDATVLMRTKLNV